MKQIAEWALNIANQKGASYADARAVSDRSRALATKNGRVGSASDSESQGIGIRVLADGAWGFAACDDLSTASVEATAARAVEIAKASARVKQQDVHMVPEKPVVAEWITPYKVDPFTTSVEQNLELLLKIDSELRSVHGVTLAESNMNFRREEQWFVSTEGAKYPPDKIHNWRRLCRVRFCRQRNPEAVLSDIFRWAMAEQRLRTHRRIEAGRECTTHWGRSSCVAEG